MAHVGFRDWRSCFQRLGSVFEALYRLCSYVRGNNNHNRMKNPLARENPEIFNFQFGVTCEPRFCLICPMCKLGGRWVHLIKGWL